MKSRPFRMEIFKLTRRPGGFLVFVFLLLLIKAFALLAGAGASGADKPGSAFIYLAESASITMKLWWFLALCIAAASLSSERNRGILRMHLSRPVKRETFFLARLSVFLLAVLVVLVADAAAGFFLASLFRTFGDVADPVRQGPQFASQAMVFSLFKCYGLTYLGMASTVSLGLLFSVLSVHPVPAMVWAAGTGIVMEGVRLTLGPPASVWMFTGYNSIHFERLSRLARGIAEYTPSGFTTSAVLIPFLYLIILSLISIHLLRRADIVE